MKKFVGRKQELKALNEIYNERDAMIVINGMRHVGKTGLVNRFIQDKPALYFSAAEVSDEINRKNFQELILNRFGRQPNRNVDLPDWNDLFRIYANRDEQDRKVLIIDNIDHIIQANPNFLKTLVSSWERYLKPKNVLFIGILSNNSILTSLENRKNPLMNAVNLRIKLQPVSFIEMLRDYPGLNYSELVSLYSLAGGMPKYWTFFEGAKGLSQQLDVIRRDILNPQGWFYSIPVTLLEKDVWEPYLYTTLLSFIASGAHSLKELEALSGYKAKDLQTYLYNLEQLGYVKKGVSVHERKFKDKKARYYIASPMLYFWFRFVFPNLSYLESNHEEVVLEKVRRDFPDFVQNTFRDISQEVFLAGLKQNSMSFDVTKIGRFWNETHEIPIVAIDRKNKQLFLADVCFNAQDYSPEKFENFIRQSWYVKELNKYKDYNRIYGLFTATAPENELIAHFLENEDQVLFSGTTLFRKQ